MQDALHTINITRETSGGIINVCNGRNEQKTESKII